MVTAILTGRFLLLGITAWVVAIGVGLGARFGLWRWKDRWPLAGAFAGLGAFGMFIVQSPVPVPLLGWLGGLFVGCGIAVTYGSLFLQVDPLRPRLEEGSADEYLWIRDASERLRPQRLDWLLTAALLAPGVGMIRFGFLELGSMSPVVIGIASMIAPLYAAVGLTLRKCSADRLLEELEARNTVGAGAQTREELHPRPAGNGG